MIPERIAEIEALAKGATLGPWITVREEHENGSAPDHGVTVSQIDDIRYGTSDALFYTGDYQGAEEDAAFIAAARTAIPELLAALDEAKAAEKEYTDHWHEECGISNELRGALAEANARADRAEAVLVGSHIELALATARAEERERTKTKAVEIIDKWRHGYKHSKWHRSVCDDIEKGIRALTDPSEPT